MTRSCWGEDALVSVVNGEWRLRWARARAPRCPVAIRTELTPGQVMLKAQKGRLVPVSGVLIRPNPLPSATYLQSNTGSFVSARPPDSLAKA